MGKNKSKLEELQNLRSEAKTQKEQNKYQNMIEDYFFKNPPKEKKKKKKKVFVEEEW